MKHYQNYLLCLIFSLLLPSISHSYENLVLQGTIDEIAQNIITELKARNFNKAEETLNNLLTSRRKSPHGTRMLEEVYYELAEFDDIDILDQWCIASTNSHFPLVVKGNVFLKKAKDLRGNNYAGQIGEDTRDSIQKFLVKAQMDFESAYSINPEDAASPAGMVAISLLRSYPPDVMESWFDKSIKADPAWMRSYREKLYYLAPWWHGTKEKMESFVQDCYENSPEGSVVYTLPLLDFSIYYKVDYFRGDYMPNGMKFPLNKETMISDALSRYQKEYPKSPEPEYYQGLFYSMGGSHEDALRFFRKAAEKDARFIKARTGEAFTELVLERFDNAEKALQAILQIDPKSPFALMNLGYVKMVRYNEHSEGIKLFNQGVQNSTSIPLNTDAMYRMAQFLSRKEKNLESIECFSKVLEMSPDHTRSLLGRAVAKSTLGDFDSAMEDALIVKNMGGKDAESAGRIAEQILNDQNKKDLQAKSEQAVPAPVPAVDTAAVPPVPSSPTTDPVINQDSTESPKEVVTADIRQTVDESPTAVTDNRTLQERFETCEGLYFRRLQDQAIDCFSSILLEAPEYAKTYFMLGQIAEKLEADLKKAKNYYTQAASKDQGNAEYMIRLGQVLHMDGNFSEAIQVLTKLIELSPTNGEAYYQRGLCFDALGQKDQAIEDMQKASMYAGKSDAADYLNRNVVNQVPPPPKIDKVQELISLSEQNFNMQRFDQAEKQLREVLEINPKNDYAIFRLGIIFIYRDHDQKKALAQYNKAIELNDTYKDYYLNRAAVYRYLEEYQKEADDYTRALALSPKEGYLYGERAECMMKLGKYADAAKDLKKAMELSPDRRDQYNRMLAEISAKTGSPLEEGSTSPTVLLERGKKFAEQKDFENAKKDMEEAIRLDPKFANAFYEMGRMHMDKMRLPDEALPYYSKAIELDKSNRDFFFHRGLAYYEKRDFANARTDFTRALELEKDDTQVYYYRGVCNKELGDKDQAVEDLLKARKDSGWAQAVDGLLNSMM